MLLHVAQDAGDFTDEQHSAVARRLKVFVFAVAGS